MDEKTVRERLAKLHTELDDAHRENPAARDELSRILPEVKRLSETGIESSDAALPARLERVAVQFEADHPAIAGSVRRIVDLLAEVGI
jgi:predicted  nucleic acid-binding Zn-ribbon protein